MFTESEIIEHLTFGWRPLRYCFLMDDLINYWDPDSCFVMTILIDDQDAALACKSYLQSHEAVYSSLREIAIVAKKQGWENWQALQDNPAHSRDIT